MFLLKLVPAPLHRALYRLAHALRRRVWRLRRPVVEGVRVIALDARGQVLLVRHSYGSPRWMPPGGGLRRNEDPVPAAVRELVEETRCALSAPRLIAVTAEDIHGASNTVHIVAGRASGSPRADRREIVEAGFFALDALPEYMPPGLSARLRAWAALYRD